MCWRYDDIYMQVVEVKRVERGRVYDALVMTDQLLMRAWYVPVPPLYKVGREGIIPPEWWDKNQRWIERCAIGNKSNKKSKNYKCSLSRERIRVSTALSKSS